MALILGTDGFIGRHMRSITEPGIICMAGISNTTVQDEAALRQANFCWPAQVFRDAVNQSLPFVYASSASVYGNGDGPLNAYARSKAQLDAIMKGEAGHWYGLRFFNVYGPGEERKGPQASIVSRIARGELTKVFFPETRRDFVHVSDCVRVAQWLLQALPPSGIYDVGTGVARSVQEIIDLIGAKVEIVPMPPSLEGKYQFNTCADLGPLRAAGYPHPFLALEDGLRLL